MGAPLSVTASAAKQNFGELLASAALAPVAIERHGKVVAVIGPPGLLAASASADQQERLAARQAQRAVEQRRLLHHHRVALQLATAPAADRRRLLAAAAAAVDRWERDKLCSPDYVRRWRAWLGKPLAELARHMTAEDDAWAPAMRQNSPFLGLEAA
jgi:hypothetical protein